MMRFAELLNDGAVLAEVGRRVEAQRLQRDLTQEELAARAGLGRATLQRLERGETVQTRSLVKILRALDLLEGLEAALPAPGVLPILELERREAPPRRRARGRRGGSVESGSEPWRWGDDPAAGG